MSHLCDRWTILSTVLDFVLDGDHAPPVALRMQISDRLPFLIPESK